MLSQSPDGVEKRPSVNEPIVSLGMFSMDNSPLPTNISLGSLLHEYHTELGNTEVLANILWLTSALEKDCTVKKIGDKQPRDFLSTNNIDEEEFVDLCNVNLRKKYRPEGVNRFDIERDDKIEEAERVKLTDLLEESLLKPIRKSQDGIKAFSREPRSRLHTVIVFGCSEQEFALRINKLIELTQINTTHRSIKDVVIISNDRELWHDHEDSYYLISLCNALKDLFEKLEKELPDDNPQKNTITDHFKEIDEIIDRFSSRNTYKELHKLTAKIHYLWNKISCKNKASTQKHHIVDIEDDGFTTDESPLSEFTINILSEDETNTEQTYNRLIKGDCETYLAIKKILDSDSDANREALDSLIDYEPVCLKINTEDLKSCNNETDVESVSSMSQAPSRHNIREIENSLVKRLLGGDYIAREYQLARHLINSLHHELNIDGKLTFSDTKRKGNEGPPSCIDGMKHFIEENSEGIDFTLVVGISSEPYGLEQSLTLRYIPNYNMNMHKMIAASTEPAREYSVEQLLASLGTYIYRSHEVKQDMQRNQYEREMAFSAEVLRILSQSRAHDDSHNIDVQTKSETPCNNATNKKSIFKQIS